MESSLLASLADLEPLLTVARTYAGRLEEELKKENAEIKAYENLLFSKARLKLFLDAWTGKPIHDMLISLDVERLKLYKEDIKNLQGREVNEERWEELVQNRKTKEELILQIKGIIAKMEGIDVFVCKGCKEKILEGVILSCGHISCKACADKAIEENRRCQTCKGRIYSNYIVIK